MDLVIIDMQYFDVVLRMDLLSKYNAIIYCRKKKVIFHPVEEEKFEMIGDPRRARTPLISSKETFEVRL